MPLGKWNLVVCGLNHKTSSLEEREPLQITRDEIAAAHVTFCDLDGIKEITIVSTCNRNEFYAIIDQDHDIFEAVKSFYLKFKNHDIIGLREHFYIKEDIEAVRHLYRVAAGIDSMVIGENQILSQVKEAYSSACQVKTAGKIIHRLFHQAFRVGKRVRSDTEMGRGACSVSGASMELLRSKMIGLDIPEILFIGINKMIALASANLYRDHNANFSFANRTMAKAVRHAARFKAEGFGLDNLPFLISRADVIVSCTGAENPIITASMLEKITTDNPAKRLIIIDMAIPRDVEYEKGSINGIDLYDLEDIRLFVKDQQEHRIKAIPQAEEIIAGKLSEFMYWFDHVRNEPGFNGMGDYFEEIRKRELVNIIGDLDIDKRKEIESATRRLVEKLLEIKIRDASRPD